MNVLSLFLFIETTNSCSVLLYQLKSKTKLKNQPQKQLSMFGYLLTSFRFIFSPLICCFSVVQSCPNLCYSMDYSTPGFPVLHCLPVCSNPWPLSWWCHPTSSSSVAPFSSCPQSFLASESFPMSQLFPSGGQSIGASALASVLPMNIQGWFPLGLTGWISLLSRDSQESSPAPQFENIDSLVLSLLYGPNLTSVHDYWKNHSFDYKELCWQTDVSAFYCAV